MSSNYRLGAFLLSLCAAAFGSTSVCKAETIIHDFQNGTFGPFNVQGAPVVGAVVADNEPDFAGDLVGFISDPDGGFQTVMQMTTGGTLALLPALHANDTIEWEVDSATYTGDFANNHVVFQSNDPIGFNVLDGSAQFMSVTTADQTYRHTYGTGEGRTILNTIDPDHDGDINEHGFTFFNIFIIQQAGDGQSSALAYDDIRLTTLVPEPTSVMLFVLGSVLAIATRSRGRFAGR
jgi:hypothetical protein